MSNIAKRLEICYIRNMQKVEYTEEMMKWVDYFIEMHVLNNIINRYGKARSILGGLCSDEVDNFPSELEQEIEGRICRYGVRLEKMMQDQDNIREHIRAEMESMMRGHLYHVESRSDERCVDLYIRVSKVEWEDFYSLKVIGEGIDIDVNYNIIRAETSCSFPIWDSNRRPHSLNKERIVSHSGTLDNFKIPENKHFENKLPWLTEFTDEQEVKQELLKRTFGI